MGYKLGDRSLKRLNGVDPELIQCINKALETSSFDMTIPWMGGVRTAEEQNDIFLDKNSKCDGYEKVSYHQSGFAADVIPVDGAYGNTHHFLHFAQHMFKAWQEMIFQGEAHGILEWGGLWGKDGWDKAHWQKVYS